MRWFYSLAIACIFVYSGVASAANAGDMLANFARSFPAIWKLTTAAAYLIGFVFVIRSIMGFKAHGEKGGAGGGIKLPIVLFIVGAILIFSPSVMQTMMMTTFGSSSPLLGPTTGNIDISKYWQVLAFIQLIGVISFIRGWILIVGTSQQGGQHSMGKAITHIVGGLLAVNIGGVIDMMNRTFGLG